MDFNCSTIILSIDGLRASALGAYGETSYETPGFNRLAAESVTYDWCYADTELASINLKRLIESYITLQGSSHTYFASDKADLLEENSFHDFLEAISLESSKVDSNAESVGQTQFASVITQFAEQLTVWQEQAFTSESPCKAWLHLSSLHTIWDAPRELSESLLDEEDSPISASVTPSKLSAHDVDEAAWCEARFHASCRYAAQVMVLDACLEGLFDFLEELFEGHAWQLLLVGTSGYSLGEHGEIGSKVSNLYSEQQQVPLLWKTINPDNRFSREQNLTLLSKLFASKPTHECPTKDSAIVLNAKNGKRSIRTDDWYLIQPCQAIESNENELQLFVKPDDRWEQNDVFKIEEATAERLLALHGGNQPNKQSS